MKSQRIAKVIAETDKINTEFEKLMKSLPEVEQEQVSLVFEIARAVSVTPETCSFLGKLFTAMSEGMQRCEIPKTSTEMIELMNLENKAVAA